MNASATNLNVNVCYDATVTSSIGGQHLGEAVDDFINPDHSCGDCAELPAGPSWVTLDLGAI